MEEVQRFGRRRFQRPQKPVPKKHNLCNRGLTGSKSRAGRTMFVYAYTDIHRFLYTFKEDNCFHRYFTKVIITCDKPGTDPCGNLPKSCGQPFSTGPFRPIFLRFGSHLQEALEYSFSFSSTIGNISKHGSLDVQQDNDPSKIFIASSKECSVRVIIVASGCLCDFMTSKRLRKRVPFQPR